MNDVCLNRSRHEKKVNAFELLWTYIWDETEYTLCFKINQCSDINKVQKISTN